jgi:energy-coupling factor transport system ATP-binding protein
VAAALARQPSLLIADEVTSMVDQDGRDGLMSVLSGLTQHHRMSLVHITHYNSEADAADRVINLTGNGGAADNTEMVETAAAPAATVPSHHPDAPVLELNGVGHEYASGTPWATTALRDINFAVHEGRRCADPRSQRRADDWPGSMAGLTVPTVGGCLLDGARSRSGWRGGDPFRRPGCSDAQPRRPGSGLGGRGSGRDHGRVVEALATVGLDPALQRRIDQLSGGHRHGVLVAYGQASGPIPPVDILRLSAAGSVYVTRPTLAHFVGTPEELRRRAGLTVVVISHDFSGLEELCPRTLHLHDGALAAAPTAAGGMS